MKTHPHIQGRFLTRISTDTLLDAVASDAFADHRHRTFRALMLAELAYRFGIRQPGICERIWRTICGTYRKLPRGGFMSPSQAWPTERQWAQLN